jgi:hypothetical protein
VQAPRFPLSPAVLACLHLRRPIPQADRSAQLRAILPAVPLASIRADISLGRGEARLRGIDGRAAASVANNAARYGGNGSYGRRNRYWPYAAAAAAYAYGSSSASSRDGCYYVSTYRAYGTRRVLVCDGE